MALRNLMQKYIRIFLPVLLLTAGLTACTYKDRVAPIGLPETAANMVETGGGLKISARAFTSQQEARQAFGFNARKAGLLPVQITFQNDSSQSVTVIPEQTFLIDDQRNAWPILPREKAYQRAKGYVEVGETFKGAAKPSLLLGAAGAVAGLAVGIVTGNDLGEAVGKGAAIGAAGGAIAGGGAAYAETGEKIKMDLATMTLKNQAILPNQIAYGALFFPGTPGEEAETAQELRLTLRIGTEPQVVTLLLASP